MFEASEIRLQITLGLYFNSAFSFLRFLRPYLPRTLKPIFLKSLTLHPDKCSWSSLSFPVCGTKPFGVKIITLFFAILFIILSNLYPSFLFKIGRAHV